MIHTRICEILGIEHPIALGSMPSKFNSPELVAAVSNAGAIGMIGSTDLDADAIHACAKSIRKLTAAPFAFNSLMFLSDEAGFAAALAFGAEGILLGTRFLASKECGIDANYKQAILDSDGHDTVLTEIPDIAASQVWPGAMSRVKHNRFVERWSGREWLLRQNLPKAVASVRAARKKGDTDEAPLFYGQDAGLINDLPPAATIIERLVADAENLITSSLAQMIRG